MSQHPALQYAHDVLNDRIVACKHVKNACQRFLNDLERTDIWMDWEDADSKINMAEQFYQFSGRFAGHKIELQPYQKFAWTNLFGFKRYNSEGQIRRRFGTSYIEIPRKNGKTTDEALKLVLHLIDQDEQGQEIYATARKEDQAKIVVNYAGQIVNKTPALYKRLKTFDSQGTVRRIVNYNSGGFIAPLASDSRSQEGLNSSWASVDEYHTFPDDELKYVVENSMSARLSPVLDIITTAGKDRHSVCYEFRKVVINVLDGVVDDDNLFGMIFTLDEDDDYTDESVWAKANPNLGHAKTYDYLSQSVKNAKDQGSTKEVDVLTKDFNVWTDVAETWIQQDTWQALAHDYTDAELKGVPCYGGLDLSSTTDLTAFVLCFDFGDHVHFKYWFFTPKERANAKDEDAGTPYMKWVRDGYLLANEGNVVDYDYLQQVIENACATYNVQSIAYDKYNAIQLVLKLQDKNIQMSPFGQGIVNISPPTKDFKKRALQGELTHDTNECMDWQISNIEIYQDANENVKITKKNAHKSRVDGAVASVMALGELTTYSGQSNESIYDSQDVPIL